MFKRIRSRLIFLIILSYTVFSLLLLSLVYTNQKNLISDMTITNSKEIVRLEAESIGREISINSAVLKSLTSEEEVVEGDLNYIYSRLNSLIRNDLASSAFYISEEGTIITEDGKRASVTDREYFKVLSSLEREFYLSDPLIGKISGTPTFGIAVSIINSNGEFKGILAFSIQLEKLSQKVDKIGAIEGSSSWITNSNERVVAHNNRELLLKKIEPVNNKKYITLDINIPNLPGWILHHQIPLSRLNRSINTILSRIMILTVVVLILLLIIIIKITDRITIPLGKLIKAVNDSQKKKFKKLEIDGVSDEIGALVRSYNRMTEEISSYTTDLEKLVEKRTRELNTINKKLCEDNENLYNIATKDSLTGLLNRRAINQIIEKEMHRHFRYNSPVTMLIIDIDYFKRVNDSYGHDVGDKVLIEISNIIINNSRGSDTVARWGGEEFLLLASHTSTEGAVVAANNIRRAVKNNKFDKIGYLTVSIGISTFKVDESFKEWFKRADIALYKAKNSGRDRVETA